MFHVADISIAHVFTRRLIEKPVSRFADTTTNIDSWNFKKILAHEKNHIILKTERMQNHVQPPDAPPIHGGIRYFKFVRV